MLQEMMGMGACIQQKLDTAKFIVCLIIKLVVGVFWGRKKMIQIINNTYCLNGETYTDMNLGAYVAVNLYVQLYR